MTAAGDEERGDEGKRELGLTSRIDFRILDSSAVGSRRGRALDCSGVRPDRLRALVSEEGMARIGVVERSLKVEEMGRRGGSR